MADLSKTVERRQAFSETRRRSIGTLPSLIICLQHTEHTLRGTWLLSTFVLLFALLPRDPPGGESHLREHCPGLSPSKLYPLGPSLFPGDQSSMVGYLMYIGTCGQRGRHSYNTGHWRKTTSSSKLLESNAKPYCTRQRPASAPRPLTHCGPPRTGASP